MTQMANIELDVWEGEGGAVPVEREQTRHEEWYEAEPDENYPIGSEIDCWPCWHEAHGSIDPPLLTIPPKRKCVKLGPVAGGADPTQTYVLECGHTVI